MRTSEFRLRKLIRAQLLNEYFTPEPMPDLARRLRKRFGMGTPDKLPSASSTGRKGHGWEEFRELAVMGDYDSASEWLRGLSSDYGVTNFPREAEDELIELALDNTVKSKDLQAEFDLILDTLG